MESQAVFEAKTKAKTFLLNWVPAAAARWPPSSPSMPPPPSAARRPTEGWKSPRPRWSRLAAGWFRRGGLKLIRTNG